MGNRPGSASALRCLLATLIGGMLTGAVSGCNWTPQSMAVESAPAPASSAAEPEPQAPAAPEPQRLKPKLEHVAPDRLFGTWKDRFFGTRTLILNSDGTARMILDLDLAARLMYGSHLEFDMRWSVADASVSIEILSGTPKSSADSLMKSWGTRFEYLLDLVEQDRVEMRDWDGSMSYSLRRATDESSR